MDDFIPAVRARLITPAVRAWLAAATILIGNISVILSENTDLEPIVRMCAFLMISCAFFSVATNRAPPPGWAFWASIAVGGAMALATALIGALWHAVFLMFCWGFFLHLYHVLIFLVAKDIILPWLPMDLVVTDDEVWPSCLALTFTLIFFYMVAGGAYGPRDVFSVRWMSCP